MLVCPFSDATSTPSIVINPVNATGAYAADPLDFPVIEPVHPDVIDFGAGNTWNGYRYWMAFTPYPGGDSSFENPSIVASVDGDTWVVPDGLTNPIATPDETNFADPDLIYDNGALYCIWENVNQNTNTGKIYMSHSTDGITWTAKQVIYTTDKNLKGPAVIKIGSTFYIYYSDNQAPMTIYRISSSSMTSGWGNLTACTYAPGLQMSHIEAVYADGLVYLYDDNGQNFGLSHDGLDFIFNANPMLTGTKPAWTNVMYRGSLVRTATGFDFWYSARDGSSVYHIGRTAVTWTIWHT